MSSPYPPHPSPSSISSSDLLSDRSSPSSSVSSSSSSSSGDSAMVATPPGSSASSIHGQYNNSSASRSSHAPSSDITPNSSFPMPRKSSRPPSDSSPNPPRNHHFHDEHGLPFESQSRRHSVPMSQNLLTNMHTMAHQAANAQPVAEAFPTSRPAPMVRQSSWGKRHASFDSPREVPMPSLPRPQLQQRYSSQESNSSMSSSDSNSSTQMRAPQPTPQNPIEFLQDRLSTSSLPLPSTLPSHHIPQHCPASSTPPPTGSPSNGSPPPRIHTPPPTLTHPFLPSNTATSSASISIQTKADKHVLLVRLPGFHRDCITLSTRGRRNLHVLADNWDGGGHFERRISFGQDADMNSIRAEFDGALLTIIVPRRQHSPQRATMPPVLPSGMPLGKTGATAGFLAARRPRLSLDDPRATITPTASPMSVTASAPATGGAYSNYDNVGYSGVGVGGDYPVPPKLQRNPPTQIHQSMYRTSLDRNMGP